MASTCSVSSTYSETQAIKSVESLATSTIYGLLQRPPITPGATRRGMRWKLMIPIRRRYVQRWGAEGRAKLFLMGERSVFMVFVGVGLLWLDWNFGFRLVG